MKNNLILAGLVAVCGYHAASANILDAVETVFKETAEYPKDTKVGVEIVNKDTKPIWVLVTNGNDVTRLTEVAGATGFLITRTRPTVDWEVNIDKPTEIKVWLKKPQKKFFLGIETGSFEPEADQIYRFPQGKTMYLTWDEKKKLRPQTGPAGGKFNKTDSNLSLAKNVTADDIQVKTGASAQAKA